MLDKMRKILLLGWIGEALREGGREKEREKSSFHGEIQRNRASTTN